MMRRFPRLHRLGLAAVFALTGAFGLSVWMAGVASAHASYVSSDPAAGAVLATAPTQVTVHFAEHVNPAGANGIPSSLQVFLNTDLKNTDYSDQDATLVSTDTGQVSTSDTTTMTVNMKGAGNGIYEVYWHTVSADDGDPDSGVFFFGVGTGSLQGVVVVTKTVTNTVQAGPPVWVTILVGILALVVGAGIVAGLRRRPQAVGATSESATAASPPGGTPSEKR